MSQDHDILTQVHSQDENSQYNHQMTTIRRDKLNAKLRGRKPPVSQLPSRGLM